MIGAFAWPLPLRVLGELLGLPREDLAQLHDWGNDWLLVQQDGPLREAARRMRAARSRCSITSSLPSAGAQREPTDDLIGALVAARDTASIRR